MALSLLQAKSLGNYQAVINIPVVGVSTPKLDRSTPVLTADVPLTVAIDENGFSVASYAGIYNFTAAGSQLLKTGSGVLDVVVVGTHNTGASLELWDSTSASGQVISIISSTSGVAPTSLTFLYQFQNGLYATATGSGFNFTVLWN